MNYLKLVWSCVLTMILFASFHLLPEPEWLDAKLKSYLQNHPSTTLYLHLDKNNYSPNETIWFKAYVLKAAFWDNEAIYVRLVNENNQIVLRREFLTYDVRAHGDLQLPANIREGNYVLFAYTDRMLNFNPRDVFFQPITIRRDAEKKLEAQAFVTDTNQLIRGKKVQITLKVKEGIDLLKNVKGNYTLLDGSKTIKSGKVTTNLFGEAFVEFVYPQIADSRVLQLKASFRRQKDYADLLLNLRHEGSQLNADLFPEGGNLIEGMAVRTVLQTTDVNRNPVTANITLLDGDKVLRTIRTNAAGNAVFNFTPQTGAEYKFQAFSSGRKYTLPFKTPVKKEGYGISLVRSGSRLRATFKNVSSQGDVMLLLQAPDSILWCKKVSLARNDSLLIPFVLDSLPKTLLSLLIINNEGKVEAERIFQSKPNEENTLTITCSEKIYDRKKKVTLNLTARNVKGSPVSSNLSVAVVEKNAITPAIYRTIMNGYYYSAIGGKPIQQMAGISDADFDQLLITKKWWYSWDEIVNYTSKEKISLGKNASGVTGLVIPKTKDKFNLKYLSLRSVKNPLLNRLIPVSENGLFSIPAKEILIDEDDELYIPQSNEFFANYEITYITPERSFDKKVLEGGFLKYPAILNTLAVKKPEQYRPSLKKMIQIKEVTIGAKPSPYNFETGECSDYVCIMNILNCGNNHNENSAGSFSPVEKGRYRYRNGLVTYYGCNDYRFKSIASPKSFFAPDYRKDEFAQDPIGTTTFWSPNVSTSTNGNGTISFYTTNLTGDFIVIAQGITIKTLEPLYGSASFSVR